VGVDAEQVERFATLVDEPQPWPLVFSTREASRCQRQVDPARALCAAFCCKEALLKALERPFDWRDCQLRPGPLAVRTEVELSQALRREYSLQRATARVLEPVPGELAVTVYLWREAP